MGCNARKTNKQTTNRTQEALEGYGDLKIGEQIIRIAKYVGDLVLLAQEEAVLQGGRD